MQFHNRTIAKLYTLPRAPQAHSVEKKSTFRNCTWSRTTIMSRIPYQLTSRGYPRPSSEISPGCFSLWPLSLFPMWGLQKAATPSPAPTVPHIASRRESPKWGGWIAMSRRVYTPRTRVCRSHRPPPSPPLWARGERGETNRPSQGRAHGPSLD